jgi:hypothetical protein
MGSFILPGVVFQLRLRAVLKKTPSVARAKRMGIKKTKPSAMTRDGFGDKKFSKQRV